MKTFYLKSFIFILLAASLTYPSFAQGDSCRLRISLLTCAPGSELYSTFGHTAIRVEDSTNGTDVVFNYGTFEFTPDFNIKFIRGKLLYSLSVESFPEFLYTYQVESRTVQSQELNLNCSEKNRLFNALKTNALPQNRSYRYDFLFDNCTTRAGAIIAANTDSTTHFPDVLEGRRRSFRDLIHEYLDAGFQPWSKLGIDILLGAPLDRKMTRAEAMFLPDYLLKGFDGAASGHHALAGHPQTILAMPSALGPSNLPGPATCFVILAIIVIACSFIKKLRGVVTVFDFIFFFLLGLAGVLLLFMWFGTDHAVCRNNYNLIWALPTHLGLAFFVHSRRHWVTKYFQLCSLLMLILILAWFFLPQEMNPALIPIVVIAGFRSGMISLKNRYAPAGRTSG